MAMIMSFLYEFQISITKVCIINGSSACLGLATAKKLVGKDFQVIFVYRDEVKTVSLLEKLKQESELSNFEFMKLDRDLFDFIKQ
jgi:short-subunit dehydrogenase